MTGAVFCITKLLMILCQQIKFHFQKKKSPKPFSFEDFGGDTRI